MKRSIVLLLALLLLVSCAKSDETQGNPPAVQTQSSAVETQTASEPVVGARIGDRFPNLMLQGLDGQGHQIEDFRGKSLIVVFWTST